jgi:hypothetical protein
MDKSHRSAASSRTTLAAARTATASPSQSTKNIEALIADGGDVSIGALPPHECAATAADGSNCLAMLVRRDGETFNALLKRLDKAIGMAWSDDLFIDEVNDGESDLL